MTLPPPLGFAGDPHLWIRTAEVAARMGYACLKTFYNDKARRAAARFPAPVRPGLWRLGDLQAWDADGGFSQIPKPGRPKTIPKPEGAQIHAIRPDVARRLQALKGTG